MNEQKSCEVIEDNISEEQIAKRLKTEDIRHDNNSLDVIPEDVVNKKEPFMREKLRKWVLLLSYCGRGYYGMQRQTKDDEFPTIEYRLFESLLKSGIIAEDKYKSQHLCRFQRAARTDRGVSAIKQIVSLLLPIDFAERMSKVNEELPQDIRVMDCLRVTKFFDAKNFCDGRTYSYLMPSYALTPIDENTCQSFRLSAETLNQFNDILKQYLGSHNFHNFTSGKGPTDPSAMRYIMDMNCSQPFFKSNIEFVVIRVKGQSFMLHQIRKMIGLGIAITRGLADRHTIEKAFNTTRIDIPKAPGLGLLLEEVHYDKYNEKYGGDGIHDAIKWEDKNALIDEFKHKYIYPVIVETEEKELQMFEWLQTLIFHTYDEREQKPNEPLNLSDPTSVHSDNKSALFKAYLNVKNEQKLQNSVEKDIELNNN